MTTPKGFNVKRIGEITHNGRKLPLQCLFIKEKDEAEEENECHLEDLLLSAHQCGLMPIPDPVRDPTITADIVFDFTFKGYWVIAEVCHASRRIEYVQIQYIKISEIESDFGEWEMKQTESYLRFNKREGILLAGSYAYKP